MKTDTCTGAELNDKAKQMAEKEQPYKAEG